MLDAININIYKGERNKAQTKRKKRPVTCNILLRTFQVLMENKVKSLKLCKLNKLKGEAIMASFPSTFLSPYFFFIFKPSAFLDS